MRALFLALLAVFALAAVALSQQSPEEEKSYFLRYVEDTISSDNRRISITGIDGVLSSDATIGAITVADRKGVWLTITDAKITWTRSALLTGVHPAHTGMYVSRWESMRDLRSCARV